MKTIGLLSLAVVVTAPAILSAQSPYFVTYSHHMEEPGDLELAVQSVTARPQAGNRFFGSLVELEYGVKTWWTTELYLSGQSTLHDSTVFSGYRWENRIRPLTGEHWINPVLSLEYNSSNAADRAIQDIVGFDSQEDQLVPNAQARREKEHEVEATLILSSNFKGWDLSENFIAEKNLANEPWEFGYAVGVSRPMAMAATPRPCTFCRENFSAGMEVYGGLGTWHQFGLKSTSHYLAPTVSWRVSDGTILRISPGFGVAGNNLGFLLRAGVSYELSGFGQLFRRGRGRRPQTHLEETPAFGPSR